MTPAGVDERRVVQVVARGPAIGERPQLGSGYLVGTGLVLTAAHVICRANSVTVRRIIGRYQVAEADAVVSWIDPDSDVDLAVLRVAIGQADAAVFRVNLAPLRYGRVAGPVNCEAVGFPLFKMRADTFGQASADRRVYRDTHHAIGTTTPLSNQRGGTLEITVRPPDDDPDPEKSPWQGMSGAAVFAEGALIGLICEHHRREGARRITARRTEYWYDLGPEPLSVLHDLIGLPERGQLFRVGAEQQTGAGAGQLRDIATFTGREADFALLVDAVDQETGGGILAIHAVDGMPGVGKTAFAVHAAHRLADRFPDGQVHLQLHTHSPATSPLASAAALASLLLGDGLSPRELPEDEDARAHLWRRRTAGRRMLLLLDDAASAEQVGPLLPSAPGTLVLITSRHRLSGLSDVASLKLSILPRKDAVALLLRIASRPELAADDSEITALAELCEGLPLAIGMIAARLKRRRLTPGDVIRQFQEAGSRLGEMRDQERTVAAAFDLSYRDLTAEQQRLFRLLGARPGTETDPPAASALLGIDAVAARHLLEDLEDHRLIDELTTSSGRYRMHDLLREHAATLAASIPGGTEPAIDRLLAHYQNAGVSTRSSHSPGSGTRDHEHALSWLRTERENLLACLRYAAKSNKQAAVVGLSATLAPLLRSDGPWSDAVEIHEDAAGMASRLGDRDGLARALLELGIARRLTRNYPAALEAIDESSAIFRQLGVVSGQADALHATGTLRRLIDEYPEATDALEQALELYRDVDDPLGQANSLIQLGAIREVTADYPGAVSVLEQALRLYRCVDDRLGQANVLIELGAVRRMTGDYVGAADAQALAVKMHREAGTRLGEANALHELGAVRRMTGEYQAAADSLGWALEIYSEIGDKIGWANALNELGTVRLLTGDYPAAVDALEQALEFCREIGDRFGQANALHMLGAVRRMTGEYQAAVDALEQALEFSREIGDPLGRASALLELGIVQRLTGDYSEAADFLDQALSIFREIGDRQGQAESMNHRAALFLATGDTEQARTLHAGALELARLARSPLDEAEAAEGLGEVSIHEAGLQDGTGHLREALMIYRRLGVPGAARVAGRLAELGAENTDS